MRTILVLMIISVTLLTTTAFSVRSAAESRARADNVIGEVTGIDKETRTITIKTDQGAVVLVKMEDKATLLRIPAGEESLANAATIQLSEIAIGDRVLCSGSKGEEKQIRAGRVIVLSRSEIDRKRERDADDWKQRGVAGAVKDLDPRTGEIELGSPGSAGVAHVRIITKADATRFLRYIPGSARFADAKPSRFDELRLGDQLRALGNRTGDGKAINAEVIVFGSFKTIGAVVTEVNPQTNQIKANTLEQKRPVEISMNKDTAVRRIPQQMALAIATRIQSAKAVTSAPNPDPGGSNSTSISNQQSVGQMIDSLPDLTLSQIKVGDVIAVTIGFEDDVSPLTAVKIVAGVDSVLNAIKPPSGRPQIVRLSAGLPEAFDFSVVQP